ncbi:14686_t:CDS:2, partial [Gigaspora margarita]
STAMGGVGMGANTVEDKDHIAHVPQQSSTSLEGVGANPLKGMEGKNLSQQSTTSPVKADDPPVRKSTIGSAKDAVSSATSSVRDTVGATTASVRDTVGSTTASVKDTVGSTTASVKDTVGSTTASVKDTVGAATTTVKDTVNAAIGATIEGTYDTIVGSNTATDANKNQKVEDDSGETK